MKYTRLLMFNCLLMAAFTGLKAQTEIPVINKELLPPKGIYRFATFTEGSVIFRNGIITAVRLNYNISSDEMHFIQQNGDTLAVADPASLSFISLNGSRFYYDKGYLQTIDTANGIILTFKQVLIAEQERKEAYGGVKLHEGVRTYDFFTGNGQKYILGEDDLIKVSAREYYYFGDVYGHFSKAGKEYLYTHFTDHQQDIRQFLKTHHINFNTLDDLLALMRYCRGLK